MIAMVRPVLVNRLVSAVEALVVVTIIANIAITFSNALVRYLTNQDFSWASDAWAILISIITFLGAPAYFRRGAGMAYTALIDRSHGLRRQTLQACGLVIFLGVCGVALAAYPAFFAGQLTQTLQVIGISSGFVALAWPGAFAVLPVCDREAVRAGSARHHDRHRRRARHGGCDNRAAACL
jgi:C4-dicarboxylate transporter, DctM subunit